MFTVAHSLRGYSLSWGGGESRAGGAGASWSREAAGHVTSAVRKQGQTEAGSQLIVFHLVQDPSPWVGAARTQVGSSLLDDSNLETRCKQA